MKVKTKQSVIFWGLITVFAIFHSNILYGQNLIPKQSKKGLWGYVNEKGKFSIKPIYEKAGQFSYGLAYVSIGSYYGYVKNDGSVAIDFLFEEAQPFVKTKRGNTVAICKNKSFGLITNSGDVYLDFDYSDLTYSSNYAYCIGHKLNDKHAYLIWLNNSSPKISQYDQVPDFSKYGIYAQVSRDGAVGIIDKEGNEIIPMKYTSISEFDNVGKGYAIVTLGDKRGLVGRTGNILLECKYPYIEKIANGYKFGKNENDFGIIIGDNITLRNEYPEIVDYDELGIVCYKDHNGKYNAVTYQNVPVFSGADNIRVSDEKIIAQYTDHTVTKYIRNGRMNFVVGSFAYTTPEASTDISFSGSMFIWTDLNGVKHYANKKGDPIFTNAKTVKPISEKYVLIQNYSKLWGIETVNEQSVVPQIFDYITTTTNSNFYSGTLSYSYDFEGWNGKDCRIRIIDNVGYLCRIEPDDEGMVFCYNFNTKKYGYMNTSGQLVVPCKFDGGTPFSEGLAAVFAEGKGWGFVNKKGVLVIPHNFYEVQALFGELRQGCAVVFNGQGSYFIDKKGNPVW